MRTLLTGVGLLMISALLWHEGRRTEQDESNLVRVHGFSLKWGGAAGFVIAGITSIVGLAQLL